MKLNKKVGQIRKVVPGFFEITISAELYNKIESAAESVGLSVENLVSNSFHSTI